MKDIKFFAVVFCIIYTIIDLGTSFINWIHFRDWSAIDVKITNGDMLFTIFMVFLAGLAVATIVFLAIFKNEEVSPKELKDK